jgi:hypothetical protein
MSSAGLSSNGSRAMPTMAEAERAVGRRLALVVATESYADVTLAKLLAPGRDASDLADVLKDAAVGGFEVEVVLDAPAELLRRRVAQFCAQVGPGDLALVYLSCHGVLDDRGRLYYATVDTDRTLLSATAVSSTWLNEQLDDCRCRRQILVLDCCHSGAFAKGAKGESSLALGERFEGRGRVVLTGSRGTEYSFEHGHVVGDSVSSVFTTALVEGLRSGEADRDGDGLITVSELYDYAYEVVRARVARQTPMLWTYGAEGDLLVAHSPRGAVVKPAPLPEDLVALLESARPRVREGAVAELADLLHGPDAGRAVTARVQLECVAAQDVPSVAGAARAALDTEPAPAQPTSPRSAASAQRPVRPAKPAVKPLAGTGPSAPKGTPLLPRRRTLAIAAGAIAVTLLVLAIVLQTGGGHRVRPPQPIPMPGAPSGIAVGDHATWVARHDAGLVTKIDAEHGNLSTPVPAAEQVAAGEGAVWVSANDGGELASIDPTGGGTVINLLPVVKSGCDCAITRLQIAQGALWTSSAKDHSISKRDLISGRQIKRYEPGGDGFIGAFAVGENAVWAVASEPDGGYVIRIDPASGHRTPQNLGAGSYFNGVAYGHGTVWIADAGAKKNFATAFDPKTKRIHPVRVETGVYDEDIAVVGRTVFVWDDVNGQLTQINASRLKVEDPKPPIYGFKVGQPTNPTGSDLAVDKDAAWVTDPAGNTVYKIDY